MQRMIERMRGMTSVFARWTTAGIGALVALSSCSDEITVVTESENRPPTIVLQGPDYPPSFEVEHLGPDPYILVGDPDGLDDLSVVLVSLSEVRFLSAIVRPQMQGSCGLVPNYDELSQVDLISLLPGRVTTFRDVVVSPTAGGLHVFGRLLATGDFASGPTNTRFLQELSPAIGQAVNAGCLSGDYLMRIGVYPPAFDPPRTVFVTALEVQYVGLRFVVYDGAGNSVEATFPDFRVLYRTPTERDLAAP